MDKPDIKNHTVLLVDDNPNNLGIAAEYLKTAGYQVAVASSGSTALKRLERIEPVVILLDINMPDMDGFEICQKLKKNRTTRNIPVIFLTALDDINSIIKGFQVGGVDYLAKPVKKEELLARVLTQMENFIYKNKLEQEVKIRTKELEKSNKLLKAEIHGHMDTAENLRTILNSMGDAVIAADMDGQIIRMNPVAEELTGWTIGQAKGVPLSEVFKIINAQTRDICENPIEKVIQSGKTVGLANHTLLISRNGTEYQIADSAAPIRDAHGKVTGVVLIFRDVTEEYMVQEALQKSEKRYRLIAENVTDVIWTSDMEFHPKYISPSIYQLRGYTAREVMEQSMDERTVPESLERVNNLYNKKLKQIKAGDPLGWEPAMIDIEQYCKDGTKIWINLNVRVLPGPDNQPESILGISRDITEQRKTQNIMIQSEKMVSVGGLAAGMAHEINNPLGIILGHAQLIDSRFSPELEKNSIVADRVGIDLAKVNIYMKERNIDQYLVAIREAGTRAATIIRNMLDFSRKSDSVRANVSVQNMMDKAVDLCSNDFDLKKKYDFRSLRINRQYDETLPLVNVFETEIEQVFLNLLKNAAQAMIEKAYDDQIPAITLKTSLETGWIKIEVEDNGPGMDSTTCKRVFEPFFTTKKLGAGTGLGLSVSYFIITKNHKGEFQVESNRNGTRFTIRLPLEDSKS